MAERWVARLHGPEWAIPTTGTIAAGTIGVPGGDLQPCRYRS
jgi:hypothetical protein